MRVIVLLGAPGAGKGTQAPLLAGRLGIARISTGDLFRAAVRADSPLGREARTYMDRGALVPDDITVRMVLERLNQPDAAEGAILDGFPRNAAQAEALDRTLAVQGGRVVPALYIEVPADELFRRLSGRWICRAHGHPYHEVFNPSAAPGVCDEDGSPLYQREDDRPEIVRARLERQLPPLHEVVEHYRRAGVLVPINGEQPVVAVTDALLDRLVASGEHG
ncbi:MAG TPA: nucleoside monophosphate kinase [Candidatus Saccharimonadales bacterium]|nr:nucleoside monophosphate kinase [Candidatus Saccharimonadales bacterium]